MNYTISQIHLYPVKGLAGISVQQARLTATGLKYDRRWMLIDVDSRFVSQRERPELCLFQPSFHETGFLVHHKNEHITIPFELESGPLVEVRIWEDKVNALLAPSFINNWFSKQLNQDVQLVYMPDETSRKVDPAYATQNETVSFADAFPLLLIGESSLDLLQSKITEQISMSRFRPNIVFRGGPPHIEDTWKQIRINQLPFVVAKPCARCTVITVNPLTGVRGAEPLKTLATYRTQNSKVMFGQNMLAPVNGYIEVGMAIESH